MSLALEKMHKAMDSLIRAMKDYDKGKIRASIGDLDFVKENAQEAIYLLLAELEKVNENGKELSNG